MKDLFEGIMAAVASGIGCLMLSILLIGIPAAVLCWVLRMFGVL